MSTIRKSDSNRVSPDDRLMETEVFQHIGSNGSTHYIVVEFSGRPGRASINGARLYSPDNRYLGWWPRFSIPIRALNAWRDSIDSGTYKTRPVYEGNVSDVDALSHL